MSGTYKINGVDIIIQPRSGQWLDQDIIDIDGNGHPIYPGVYQFEMSWGVLEPSGTYQLMQFFNSIHITGSAVVTLPRFAYQDYEYFAYSGCVPFKPRFGRYFFGHTEETTMLISGIRI